MDSTYRKASDFKDQILDNYRKGKNFGEPTGYNWLDKHLTIVPGYFYCFTGWPGSGKSEFVTNLINLQAKNKQRKACVYAPEGYPMESYIETICHAYLGKSVSQQYQDHCTEQELIKAIDWVDEYYTFLNWEESAPTIDEVMGAFNYCKDFFKCQVFLIDPFNSLNEYEESMAVMNLKNNLNRMVQFTHNNKVIFFCIEHPRSPRDASEVGKIPGPHQLFMGTMWWNKVDCMAAIHSERTPEGKYTGWVTVKVHKMKNQKLNGRPGEVQAYFNIKTNRYEMKEASL